MPGSLGWLKLSPQRCPPPTPPQGMKMVLLIHSMYRSKPILYERVYHTEYEMGRNWRLDSWDGSNCHPKYARPPPPPPPPKVWKWFYSYIRCTGRNPFYMKEYITPSMKWALTTWPLGWLKLSPKDTAPWFSSDIEMTRIIKKYKMYLNCFTREAKWLVKYCRHRVNPRIDGRPTPRGQIH